MKQLVQSQKQARSLKFRIQEEEKLYYPCSENKGADQLRGYREADLRLCFRLGKNLVFSRCGSYNSFKSLLLSLSKVLTLVSLATLIGTETLQGKPHSLPCGSNRNQGLPALNCMAINSSCLPSEAANNNRPSR